MELENHSVGTLPPLLDEACSGLVDYLEAVTPRGVTDVRLSQGHLARVRLRERQCAYYAQGVIREEYARLALFGSLFGCVVGRSAQKERVSLVRTPSRHRQT